MMKCSLCGKEIKINDRNCSSCGQINEHYVEENIETMICGEKAVQIEFAWIHPQHGEVMVRFSGKRVNDSDGMIVLEGYYRMITDLIGACKGATE